MRAARLLMSRKGFRGAQGQLYLRSRRGRRRSQEVPVGIQHFRIPLSSPICYSPLPMTLLHDNLPQAIETLSARIIAIRDSL